MSGTGSSSGIETSRPTKPKNMLFTTFRMALHFSYPPRKGKTRAATGKRFAPMGSRGRRKILISIRSSKASRSIRAKRCRSFEGFEKEATGASFSFDAESCDVGNRTSGKRRRSRSSLPPSPSRHHPFGIVPGQSRAPERCPQDRSPGFDGPLRSLGAGISPSRRSMIRDSS